MIGFGIFEPATTPGTDPLVILLAALAMEAYFGRISWLSRVIPHPVVVAGRAIGWLEKKLNRERRTNMDRAVRGALSALVLVALALAAGWGIDWVGNHHDFGWVPEALLVLLLLSGRDLYDRVAEVGSALTHGVEPGRRALSHIVGRDTSVLDEHGVARGAIESLAENFSDAVVAPVFWYLLFGLPGMLAYKVINTMDSSIGYKNPRYQYFGMAAARLDDIANLAPARLAGLMIAIGAMATPGAKPMAALKTMWQDAPKHASPNAGWPEAAMAGALGIALGGPRRYHEKTVNAAWLGSGSAQVGVVDINRAKYVYVVASLVNLLVVAVGLLFRLG